MTGRDVDVLVPVAGGTSAALLATVRSAVELSAAGVVVALSPAAEPSLGPTVRALAARRAVRLADPVGAQERPGSGSLLPSLLQAALLSSGAETVTVLEPGDELRPGGLDAVRRSLRSAGRPEVVYTDEEWTDESGGVHRVTKLGWSPALLEGVAYLSRLTVVRRQTALAAGGFLPEAGSAAEYDLHLRVAELLADGPHRPHRPVQHVPLPVVRCTRPPLHADAAAGSAAPTRELAEAESEALRRRLGRQERPGVVVEQHRPGLRRVVPAPTPAPTPAAAPVPAAGSSPSSHGPGISVVLPTAGGRRDLGRGPEVLVLRCLDGLLRRTDRTVLEVVLVVGDEIDPALLEQVREEHGDIVRVVHVPGPFDFSAVVNEGVLASRGELVLLLNDDVEVVEADWLGRLAHVLEVPGVDVVGAKLLFADGRVQHVGVSHGADLVPSHPQIFEADDLGHLGTKVLDADYAAVTGACLLTRRSTFLSVGGLTRRLPLNFGDVDFCQKVRAEGGRVVMTPAAVLVHHESSTREATVRAEEVEEYLRVWAERARVDDPATVFGRPG